MFDQIIVMGRGMSKLHKSGPWLPTEDLEVRLENGWHPEVRIPVDDRNPLCMIGGSDLNLKAGEVLFNRYGAKLVVCAYGDRADYLKAIDAPSESMVLSGFFQEACPSAKMAVWTKEMSHPGKSNSNSELRCGLELAVRKGFVKVGVVTIDLHMPRVMDIVERHRLNHGFRHLQVSYHRSEQVLVEADPATYEPRRRIIRESQALKRDWARESAGIFARMIGTYDESKPVVAV